MNISQNRSLLLTWWKVFSRKLLIIISANLKLSFGYNNCSLRSGNKTEISFTRWIFWCFLFSPTFRRNDKNKNDFPLFGRNDREELGCFWRHREKLRCHIVPCFFPSPPPTPHPVTNNVATFLPAKRTTTTQFVLSYLLFFPFPSRYLRLADFFAMFWSVVAPSTLVAFFPPSNWLTAIFFLAGCVSLPISWGSSQNESMVTSIGGADRNHSRDGYLIFPNG